MGRFRQCNTTLFHRPDLLRTLPDKAQAWQDLCFAMETMQGLQLAQAAPI
jgi:hypothetical protein